MDINLLLVCLGATAVWRGIAGLRKGFAKELRKLLSLVIALFVLSLVIMIYTSFQARNTKNVVLSVVFLLIAGVAARLLETIGKSLEAIAGLPVISVVNALLGLALGIAEAVLFLCVLYIVVIAFDTGNFGNWILQWTAGNERLVNLYSFLYAWWGRTGL